MYMEASLQRTPFVIIGFNEHIAWGACLILSGMWKIIMK